MPDLQRPHVGAKAADLQKTTKPRFPVGRSFSSDDVLVASAMPDLPRPHVGAKAADLQKTNSSKPRQIRVLDGPRPHQHLAVFGAAVQRRNHFAGVEQALRVKGAFDREHLLVFFG